MISENVSKCPKGLRHNLTIGLNLKFPAKTLVTLVVVVIIIIIIIIIVVVVIW
jgi:hypothetical protein